MAGPLQQLPPSAFKAGPLGTLNINGVLSGMGRWQSNHVPGDNPTHVAPAARGATPVEPRGQDLVRVACDDAQQSY